MCQTDSFFFLCNFDQSGITQVLASGQSFFYYLFTFYYLFPTHRFPPFATMNYILPNRFDLQEPNEGLRGLYPTLA